MVARRRHFANPLVVPTETDWEQGTVDLTTIVRACQAGVRVEPQRELTPREAEIIKLFADDRTVEEIAEQLVISRYTVRSHIENMRLKYKKRSIAGIVALVLRQGWIA